ncbi:hypothetical protein ACPA9J_09915 [Pseudomonas aeruginosa]
MRDQGKILRWGVVQLPRPGRHVRTGRQRLLPPTKVMYNLEERGIEYDLLPWCQERGMPVMAYCPVGRAAGCYGTRRSGEIAARHDASERPGRPEPGYWSRG